MSLETKKAVLSHLMTSDHFSVKEATRLITSFDRPVTAEAEQTPSDHAPGGKGEA